MKKTLALLTLFALFSFSVSNAQTGKVTGRVEGRQKPIDAASVLLLRAKDSSTVKMAVTDKTGEFEIEKLVYGKYLLSIQSVGYQKFYSGTFELNESKTSFTAGTLNLEAASENLNAVVVTSKKPLIEQKIDRTIVNVDASPTNVGLSALDVLEKSPGITVDKDGNISLKGKAGVLVLVDGKPTYLSAADLANLLRNMTSNNLDQIEIMTNPPAKFDASGNAGVINIKTKKNRVKGMNGSVSLGAGMGINPKTNNSFNFNYRTGKVNFFTNYSHYWGKGWGKLELTRKFIDQQNGDLLSIFRQTAERTPNYQNHSYKIGADYFASKKTTIGFVVNGYYNPGQNRNSNVTNIYDAYDKLEKQTLAENISKEKWSNIGGNLNLKHTFDTTGTEITADLDYMTYDNNMDQLFNNYFYNQSGGKIQPDEILRGTLPSNIHIYSAKVDFTKPLKNNARFEAGLKSSYVKTDNDAAYDTLANGAWGRDTRRSNHFLYTENINAAYVNYSRPLNKKWNAQLGLRLENTIAKGEQLTTGEVFERNYTQLFPTAYLGYTMNDKNQFALSYGRRIERPDYGDMNPFYYFLDKYTYQVGNPYLRPQFSHNIELTHTYGGFLTTTFGYNKTKDIIQDVIEQIDSINTSYVRKSNIASQDNFNLSVSANFPVTKWYRANIYSQAIYNRFRGVINNGYEDVSGIGFMANVSNQFTLPKEWTLELSGFYRGRMIEGTLVSRPMGALNFAVSKNILKKKGTIRLNIRDFLDVQQFRGYSKYQNIDVDIRNQWDNRVVNLSFTYRFSKGQGAGQQRKRGGAGDEANRVKSGGN
ncbi:outer membrane beta-barrel family protein [Foetidibacter luteolus]|uniref:outer membrane beta-barrel family protein n=1 Tax=Foetidibacter luteolus TaxID=2608880 RepID=UPI00129ABBAD|nr:outer membrane beta-barrel family protein [Foetidibacter luteolus]